MRHPPVLDWVDLEDALARRTPLPRVVLGLAALMLAAYVALSARPAGALESAALTWGADWSSMFAGEWWRLLTAAFIHMHVWHLGVNVALLAIFGGRAERAYGSTGFALLYLACTSVASLAAAFGAAGVAVGTSGAVFGSAGALLPYYLLAGSAHGLPARRLDAGFLALILAGALLAGLLAYNVSSAAHFWGLVCGVVVGAALRGGQRRPCARRRGPVHGKI